MKSQFKNMLKRDTGKIVLLFILIVFIWAIANSASKSNNADPTIKNLIPNLISGAIVKLTTDFYNGITLEIILGSALIVAILVAIKYLNKK